LEKAIAAKKLIEEDDEKLKEMYAKVVGPNQIYAKKVFIKCLE
jgi:hypothetical protein